MGRGKGDCGLWNGNMLGFGWQEKALRTIFKRCCSLSSYSKGNSPCPKFPWLLPALFPKNPPKMHQGIWGELSKEEGAYGILGSLRQNWQMQDSNETGTLWWRKIPKATEVLCCYFMGMRHLGSRVWSRQGWGWHRFRGHCADMWIVASGTAFPWGKEPCGSWKHLNHGLILKKNPSAFAFLFFSGQDLLTGYGSSLWWHRFHQHQ